MEYKDLGNTGVKISEIGLGTWAYTGGDEPLRRGIALGATHIDAAEMYKNEEAVGKALRGLRESAFLATKVLSSHLRYKDVMSAADNSLRKLGMDYIDLYMIHSANSAVPIAETMRALEDLVDMGKVRFIGVSNFSATQVQEAQESMKKYKIVSNQVRYSLADRGIESSTLPYCQRNDITVVAHTPLAEGSLASRSHFRRSQAMGVLERVAEETGKTMAQVALNWCTSRENVVAIPKANSVERVVEDCGASGWRLTDQQIETLDTAFA